MCILKNCVHAGSPRSLSECRFWLVPWAWERAQGSAFPTSVQQGPELRVLGPLFAWQGAGFLNLTQGWAPSPWSAGSPFRLLSIWIATVYRGHQAERPKGSRRGWVSKQRDTQTELPTPRRSQGHLCGRRAGPDPARKTLRGPAGHISVFST